MKAVDSISSMPVFIAGEKINNYYGDAGVRFIGKYDYSQIETAMNRYRYLLNVDPNDVVFINSLQELNDKSEIIVVNIFTGELILYKA